MSQAKDAVPQVANLANATPEQLKWLSEHKCRHGHRYTSHFGCYLVEQQVEERIGALDIECGALEANVDIMLSWAIKAVGGEDTYYDALTVKELSDGSYDSRIVETCVDTIQQFDRIVTHYGSRFDIPFLRTAAISQDLYFPPYGSIWHSDVWIMAKKKLRLTSNRQNVVAEAVLGKDIKTRVEFKLWRAAKYGSPAEKRKAMKYIVDHNLKDVEQLEENYLKLKPFVRETRTSI